MVGQQRRRPGADDYLYPYLRVANVQDDLIDMSDVLEMPFSRAEKYRLEMGDILLCEGQSRELVGRAAMYRSDAGDLYFQNSIIRFRAYPGVDPEYALHVFRAYQKTGVFAAVSKATTGIAHLGLSRFRELPFPLPPTPVQREIASSARAFQDFVDVIRNSISQSRPSIADVLPRAADSYILGDHAVEWTDGTAGRAPWPVREAAELVGVGSPIVYGILQPGPEDNSGVPYIRGRDLQQGYILVDQLGRTSPSVAAKNSKSTLAAGDVLLGIIRHTRVAIVPEELDGAQITQGTARLRPGRTVDSSYLAHWVSSRAAQSWLRSRMRGIDMPGLNLKDVRRLPVPVPPLDVQREIADKLDVLQANAAAILSSADRVESLVTQLEASGLASFSYGRAASGISSRLLGTGVEKSSRELALSLGIEPRLAQQVDADADPVSQVQFDRLRVTGHEKVLSMKAGVAVGKLRGAIETSPDAIREALQSLDGSAKPADLFAQMGLAQDGVDSFYVALRELDRSGAIRVVRPDDVNVVVELVQS
ncbi:restriction endonuclease subunit S [Lentzea sp. NPDC058436]|uniref:restriction endonuclease subunit S n=1 Tax=Lentzea sp. NPDC058436 TaxID=3346499 RepID=UPI0036644A1C